MRNVYKTAAIIMIGIALISAQGVDGQPRRNNQSHEGDRGNKRDKPYDGHREVVRYDQGFRSGGHNADYGRKGDRFHQKYNRIGQGYHGHAMHFGGYGHFDKGISYRASLGQIAMHNGRMFKLNDGVFYVTRHGRWVATPGPVGLRVMRLPHGARSIRTKHGALYEFRGTFYTEARYGLGYVVTSPPQMGKGRVW